MREDHIKQEEMEKMRENLRNDKKRKKIRENKNEGDGRRSKSRKKAKTIVSQHAPENFKERKSVVQMKRQLL